MRLSNLYILGWLFVGFSVGSFGKGYFFVARYEVTANIPRPGPLSSLKEAEPKSRFQRITACCEFMTLGDGLSLSLLVPSLPFRAYE